jgi:hypothetical protein
MAARNSMNLLDVRSTTCTERIKEILGHDVVQDVLDIPPFPLSQ